MFFLTFPVITISYTVTLICMQHLAQPKIIINWKVSNVFFGQMACFVHDIHIHGKAEHVMIHHICSSSCSAGSKVEQEF